MPKIKTNELTDVALDWAVAKCEVAEPVGSFLDGVVPHPDYNNYHPSTDWAQGGPIADREKIGFNWVVSNYLHVTGCWSAHIPQTNGKIFYGPTPLIVTMRCYVASKLGDEVDVPDELIWQFIP